MGYKSVDKALKPKPKHRKGLWSPDEDLRLRNYILQFGHGCWSSVPINAGLQRNGKSCRLRWINYLRPGLKRGTFSAQEEETIVTFHRTLGNKWSQIAQHLPGRTDNEIKNFWHSHLKKKLSKATEVAETSPKTELTNSSTPTNDQNDSPSKLNTPTSSLDSGGKASEGFSSVDYEQSSQDNNNKTCLPKIFFAEWLTLDNMFNDNDNYNTHDQNSKDNIDLITYNMDLQEHTSSEEITMFNQESCSNDDELFDGVENFMFNSQLKFEDETSETGLIGDLFLHGDDINDDSFMSSNLMYDI